MKTLTVPQDPFCFSNRAISRRRLVLGSAGAAAAGWAGLAHSQASRFEPQPAGWRGFDVTTRIDIQDARGTTRVWLPVPAVESAYQTLWGNTWQGNATAARIVADGSDGAKMLYAEFAADNPAPWLELTSRVHTQSRATDWRRAAPAREDSETLKRYLAPTELLPTDGIVRTTALEATRGALGDEAKVRCVYDWVVRRTHREPTVRGCGIGDIRTMLETGNFGGKCGDINGLFVGLCRAVGVPARDLYGLRVAPSAFAYRELGASPQKLQGAQHCRAEVFLQAHGWVAMDPADVGKVMRQETATRIKDDTDPLVAPVKKALFGGWEGNWIAFNSGHDVVLPGARGPKLGFFMYPQAENDNGRYDAIDAEHFKYAIQARELTALTS